MTRPAWRSPFRVIPIVLVVLILAFGLYQAFNANGKSVSGKQETTQANAFLNACLPKVGSAPDAGYATKTVACDGPYAAGKVVAVVPFNAGAKGCPAKTTPAILVGGASRPHFECIAALQSR